MFLEGLYMRRSQLISFSLAMVFTFGLMYAMHQSSASRDLAADVESKVEEVTAKAEEIENDLDEVKSQVDSLEYSRRGW